MDAFWTAYSGSRAPWRDLPQEFGKWGSVRRRFRRWTLAGLWQMFLEGLNDSEVVPDSVQMIPRSSGVCRQTPRGDSTIVRAHHCAAGAKRGLRIRILAAQTPLGECERSPAGQGVSSRPRRISSSTATACP